MARGTGQHTDLLAERAVALPEDRRPTPGPVAILPFSMAVHEEAVVAGGGVLAPLTDDTRGIVWLAQNDAKGLADILATHPSVEWVQLPWAGVDSFAEVLADAADKPFPLWTSAKGAYSEPVAEQALGLTLALLRGYPQRALSTSWAKESTGISLFGLKVLLVGAGGIGLEIIRLLSVFDTEVTVVRRSTTPVEGAARTVTSADLHDVLPDADVVILAAASTGETASLIGAPELALMKKTAVLVNIARGALIDTDALVDALREGSILGAGLDVTSPEPLPDGHPLWSEPSCIITSHSADTPEMVAPLLANRVRNNVEALLGHGRFVGVVDPALGY